VPHYRLELFSFPVRAFWLVPFSGSTRSKGTFQLACECRRSAPRWRLGRITNSLSHASEALISVAFRAPTLKLPCLSSWFLLLDFGNYPEPR
jgi:hypothetical protein